LFTDDTVLRLTNYAVDTNTGRLWASASVNGASVGRLPLFDLGVAPGSSGCAATASLALSPEAAAALTAVFGARTFREPTSATPASRLEPDKRSLEGTRTRGRRNEEPWAKQRCRSRLSLARHEGWGVDAAADGVRDLLASADTHASMSGVRLGDELDSP
jgi:hypothetical protein